MSSLKEAEFFTVCFHESFNRIANKQQMDVHVIYFDKEAKLVRRKFLGSAFLGHADAESSLSSLLAVIDDLDWVHKLVQEGMDGSNVNWKLCRLLGEKRKEFDPECPDLLKIGSCGVHVLHGAVNSGNSATDWKLPKFFKNSYSIFKKSPA